MIAQNRPRSTVLSFGKCMMYECNIWLIVIRFEQMEQIRRANRMYTSDSLFLRPTLKIPVPDEVTPTGHNNSSHKKNHSHAPSTSKSTPSTPMIDGYEKYKQTFNAATHSKPSLGHMKDTQNFISFNSNDAMSGNHTNNCSLEPEIIIVNPNSGSVDPNSTGAKSKRHFKSNGGHTHQDLSSASGDNKQQQQPMTREESMTDFLIRIDSSIAKTKDHVTRVGSNMNSSYSESDLFLFNDPRLKYSNSSSHNHSSSETYGNSSYQRYNGSSNRKTSSASLKYTVDHHNETIPSIRRLLNNGNPSYEPLVSRTEPIVVPETSSSSTRDELTESTSPFTSCAAYSNSDTKNFIDSISKKGSFSNSSKAINHRSADSTSIMISLNEIPKVNTVNSKRVKSSTLKSQDNDSNDLFQL